MVTNLWRVLGKIDTPRLRSLCLYSTTVGGIATWITALTPPMIPLRLEKFRELWFSNLSDLVADLLRVGGST